MVVFLGHSTEFLVLLLLPCNSSFSRYFALKLSHRVLSSSRQISCSFFQGAMPLTALYVSWDCYKSFFPVAVLSYSICVICSFHILIELSKPWNDKKVFKYYKSQKKEALSNKNTSLLLCERLTAREAWYKKCDSPRMLRSLI